MPMHSISSAARRRKRLQAISSILRGASLALLCFMAFSYSAASRAVAQQVGSAIGGAGNRGAEAGEANGANEATIAQLVPQYLLGLIHAPEVQKELGLTAGEISDLEGFFGKVDEVWFRARLLPEEKRYETIALVEAQAMQWFEKNTSEEQMKRLRQIEARAQGVRMLLRPKLQTALKMDAQQKSKLIQLVQETEAAKKTVAEAMKKGSVSEKLQKAVAVATQREQEALKTVMRPEQLQMLQNFLGPAFETSSLSRIYPMAPELVAVSDWINSQPLTMEKLKGKVVLVHFYAFQCHNCHANFPHYQEWSKKYDDDQVVVLGIQTPELSRERDPAEVRAAAKQKNLTFPIMVDLDSKNWQAWGNTMWPTVYVVDQQGYIRHWWQGELNWDGATGDQTIEKIVDTLLAQNPS